MKKLLGALFVVVFVLLIGTGPVWAQDASRFDDDDSFVLKVNGSATIATNESVDGVIIIRGDVVVDGTVREGLMVYDGTATINGAVGGDIVIVSGNLVLGAGSSVKDIMLVRSDITQDPTATVDGEIQESSGDLTLGRGFLIFSILWFIGTVIAGMVAAIFFGWLGRAQLFGSVETLRSNVVGSLVTAIVLFIVLPLAAGLTVFTLVGAPLGLSILLVLLPILLALGLIVFGAWIASYLIKGSSTAAAVGTAVLGVVILALVSLIPFVVFFVLPAGMLGAGALVYRSFKRASTGALPQQS